jgi:coenzyme PQQ biosynthesis protein C
LTVLSPTELEAALRAIGAERYHNRHPFHRMLHSGGCTPDQVRAWALNRYYYQAQIPAKDSALMARLPTAELRRIWRQRIVDHDGDQANEGGIARWLRLTDALGLDRDYVISGEGLLPATRFAVDAYVNFVSTRPLTEAVASSLTEMFSADIIRDRVSGMLKHYDFVDSKALAYFESRLSDAPRDADFALAYVQEHALTEKEQEAALDALRFKCGILWTLLDACSYAYVSPGEPAPGAWRPGEHLVSSQR